MGDLTQKQESAIWSAIRSTIEGMPDIEKAIAAQRYEEASAYWDAAARDLTAHVVATLSASAASADGTLSTPARREEDTNG